MLLLGCHFSCRHGYLKMAEDAHHADSNAIQFFTRNPQGSVERELNPNDLAAFKAYCNEYEISSLIGYAPYTVNPASDKMDQRDFAQMILAEDLAHMEEIPDQLYALHPGHALDQDHKTAIAKAATMLNEVVTPAQSTTVLIVENSGEGTEICATFEEIAELLDQIKLADHVGVCFDTCAAWAAGYDIVDDLDGVLKKFDKVIGLDKIKEIHLTDSKEGKGSHVDRHATLGEGTIGFDALLRVMEHPKLAGKPFILEEPHATPDEYRHQVSNLRMHYGKDIK